MATDDTHETCVQCGRKGELDFDLMQVGTIETGRYWLHDECWLAWYMARKAERADAMRPSKHADDPDHPPPRTVKDGLSDADIGWAQGRIAGRAAGKRKNDDR